MSLSLTVNGDHLTGEIDVHTSSSGTLTWNYESDLVTVTNPQSNQAVRLPAPVDLLPATFGRRVLSQATNAELSRIADERRRLAQTACKLGGR